MIKKTDTVGKVLDMHPETGDVFMEYGLHCLTCPMSRSESIEQASAVHGIDCDALVEALNDLVGE